MTQHENNVRTRRRKQVPLLVASDDRVILPSAFYSPFCEALSLGFGRGVFLSAFHQGEQDRIGGMASGSSIFKCTKGLVAVVTGGASGLGRGAVNRLVDNGAKVAIFDLPTSKGAEVAKEFGPDRVIFAPTNVAVEADVAAAYEAVKAKWGTLDTIVNCAGIAFAFKLYAKSKKEVFPLERIKQTLDVNVLGTFNVIRLGLPLLVEKEADEQGQRGVIINTSSVAAQDGQIGQSAYSASKGAITAITLPLARDLAAEGIRVNAILPGLMDTPLLSSLPPKVRTFLGNLVPQPPRFGTPEEFGELVVQIVRLRYLNAENIRLDGGLRMPP